MAEERAQVEAGRESGFTPAASDAPRGHMVSASRTIAADVAEVYAAWTDDRARREWLRSEQFAITEENPPISLHGRLGGTRVRVFFMPRGATRTNVTVDHDQLSTTRKAEQMRKFWQARLGRLAAALERIRP